MVVEKINTAFGHYNYNTSINSSNAVSHAGNVSTNSASVTIQPSFSGLFPVFGNNTNQNINLRTQLTTKEEKNEYNTICSQLDRNTRKVVDTLLKNGVLLNNNSADKSTVLDNLYKIATQPRATGLSNNGILRDTVATIAYPFLITQQFGDIPANYRQQALAAAANNPTNNSPDVRQASENIDVVHSGTCVAASTEFKLAKQMPAEFARFAQELSSPKLSVTKKIELDNLADNTLNGVWLLNAFEIPYQLTDYNNAILTFAPDKNAILRAQIQTTNKDPDERTPLDVLMQSTFMQIGSQQSYDSLIDKRGGKFNQNDKGLIEFEKTFTESVVFDKNILSVTYQTVDENAKLVGYETDFDTMKKHLLTALDRGENVIIGYTQTNADNVIVNGHEITIVGYKKAKDGKLTFICNDTDDGISRPIEYSEDYLLPKIHHAALPKDIVENDLNIVPNWVEGINMYKEMKKQVPQTPYMQPAA